MGWEKGTIVNNNEPTGGKTGRRFIVVTGSKTRNILSVALLFRRFGYEVFISTTAAQALERISVKEPALVITDLILPDMSGLDFFQNLRKISSARSIPVIFMVFPGDAAAESRCLGYGAAGCISKPVQAEELYWTVQHVIEPKPRASIRIDTRIPVSVNNLSMDSPDSLSVVDLSENGMYVPTYTPYPANKLVAVQLHMKERTISTDSAVLYNRPGGSGPVVTPGMGLKFITIAPQDQEFIRKFIRDEITRDLNAELLRTAGEAQ